MQHSDLIMPKSIFVLQLSFSLIRNRTEFRNIYPRFHIDYRSRRKLFFEILQRFLTYGDDLAFTCFKQAFCEVIHVPSERQKNGYFTARSSGQNKGSYCCPQSIGRKGNIQQIPFILLYYIVQLPVCKSFISLNRVIRIITGTVGRHNRGADTFQLF